MRKGQDKQESFGTSFRESMDLTLIIANVHAMCLMPFLRCSFGTNTPGITGIPSLLLLAFLAGSTKDPGMGLYLLFWAAALMYQRARTNWLVRRGWRAHSQYWGWPWFAMLFLFRKEEDRAKNLEPILCLFIGGLLCPLSPAVGFFVICGLVSLSLVRGVQLESTRRQIVAMQDLEIEQRALSERVRRARGTF